MKIIILLSVCLASCAVTVDKPPIPLPPRDPLIRLTPQQDDLLFNTFPEIYDKLGKRDNQCWGRVEQLELLIERYNE